MELAFNELSEQPLAQDRHAAQSLMERFSKAAATGHGLGIRRIRSDKFTHQILLVPYYTLHDWLFSPATDHKLRNNLVGMFDAPFIRDQDQEQLEQFVHADGFYSFSETGVRVGCLGLVTAWVYQSATISLATAPAWMQRHLTLHVIKDALDTRETIVNIHSAACFEDPIVQAKLEHGLPLVLVEREQEPTKQDYHPTGHHGQDLLKALWNRVKKCPYILSAMDVQWGGKNFIREVTKDGYITLVLTDSIAKYALRVKTTGRNLRETQAIADHLQDRYDD